MRSREEIEKDLKETHDFINKEGLERDWSDNLPFLHAMSGTPNLYQRMMLFKKLEGVHQNGQIIELLLDIRDELHSLHSELKSTKNDNGDKL